MEPYKIYMYETDPKKDRIAYISLSFIGIICLSLYLIFDIRSEHVFLFYLVICLIGIIGYKRFIKRNFICVDDEGIRSEFARIGWTKFLPPYLAKLNKVYVRWEDIQSLSKEPLGIIITLNDGSQEKIYIGSILYKDHQELREKLQEYIELKGIATTH